MKVTIKEKLYDYVLDYPNDWQSTSGDFYKCPVLIGDVKCFIKRFEKKTPRDIPGWELLHRLKHKNEANLPRIFDIVNINERGKAVYYIFYEYLKGVSLDDKIAGEESIDLERLTIELFSAIESIGKYNYWFADFTEKNILIQDTGRTVLLDLDSAQPSSKLPDRIIYRDKQYWSVIYKYYTDILRKEESGILNIPGICINYLQLLFLVLHLKLFIQNEQVEYHSPVLLNDLPAYLSEIDPAFNALFNKIYNDGNNLQAIDKNEIKELIFQKIIYNTNGFSSAREDVPEIISFKSSTSTVNGGESFTLAWQVKNATTVEIHKNGIVLKKLAADVNNINLNEFYDGKDKEIEYSLIANNSSGKSKPKQLSVKITDKLPSAGLPAIISFSSSNETVQKGSSFTLQWELKNAIRIELFKNGILFKKLTADNKSIPVNEFYDGKDKDIEYGLLAINENGSSKRELITVRITDKIPAGEPLTDNTLTEIPPVTNEPPVIISFKASALSVKKGEKFNLEWEVNNATSIVIYKNEKVFKKLGAETTSLATTAYSDEKNVDGLVFTLLAGNDSSEVKSDPILVDVKTIKPIGWLNPKKIRLMVFGALTLIILLVLGFIFIKNFQGKIEISDFLPDKITEEHTIVISGNNLPSDTGNMIIMFNKIKGKIEYSSKNIMRVNVPNLADNLGDGNVEVALVFKGDTIYAPKKLLVTRNVVQNTKDTARAVVQDNIIDSPEAKVIIPKTKVLVKQDKEKLVDSSQEKVTVQPEVKKIEEPKKTININDFVKVTSNEFRRKALGGVKNLKLTVQNDSPYDLDNVKVAVSYLKKNEREIKKETIVFSNVKAHANSTIDMPDTHRGAKVSFNIVSISSKQLDADQKR